MRLVVRFTSHRLFFWVCLFGGCTEAEFSCHPESWCRRRRRLAAMFDALSDRLGGVFDRLRSKGRLTEDDVDSAMLEHLSTMVARG